jgi:hypothetical protein
MGDKTKQCGISKSDIMALVVGMRISFRLVWKPFKRFKSPKRLNDSFRLNARIPTL